MARSPVKAAVAALIAGAPIDERYCVPRLYSHFKIAREVYGCRDPTSRQLAAVRRAVAALVASGDVIGETDPDWPAGTAGPPHRRNPFRRLMTLGPAPVVFTRRMTAEEQRDRERFLRESTRELRERFSPGPPSIGAPMPTRGAPPSAPKLAHPNGDAADRVQQRDAVR